MNDNHGIDIKACNWARQKHEETNHLYDGSKYEVHLWAVVDIARMFIHYIPANKKEIVIAACWLHDTIEDCRVTYNDIKNDFGEEIADIVYAVTNEKCKTRKEQANNKYYEGIRNTQFAGFVKVCDRIANVKYSLEKGRSMFNKYRDESIEFQQNLECADYFPAMWEYMNSLFNASVL
jgi:(p)ppGpp synthase/HD superfamily hydrolase